MRTTRRRSCGGSHKLAQIEGNFSFGELELSSEEFDGLEKPNAYGRHPLKRNAAGQWDPELPGDDGESDGKHVDFVVNAAAKRGMYMAILPTWGDKYNLCWGVSRRCLRRRMRILWPLSGRAYHPMPL